MEIVKYLQEIEKLGISEYGKKYYEFLLKNGKTFKKQSEFKKLNHVEVKMCFKNSFLTAVCSNVDYYEGFYLCEDLSIPLEHAFNKRKKAKQVIDVTAEKFDIPVKEWFGVLVPNWVLCEWFNGDQNLTPLQYYFKFKIMVSEK